MTHSGGKPHAVGDRGQRYEVSVFDKDENKRRVIGWSDDLEYAGRWAKSSETRPGWTNGRFVDRQQQEAARVHDGQTEKGK